MTINPGMDAQDDEDRLSPDPSDDDVVITADDYKKLTGESLAQTVDLRNWKKSYEALTDYRRFEAEVLAAESSSAAFRKVVRDEIFPEIERAANAPAEAGVFKMPVDEVERIQLNSLMNGLVEACDGNVHVFNTLTMQIVQIAVIASSYKAEEEAWSHRIFKHDIKIEPGTDVIKETLRLLRASVPGQDGAKKTKKLSEMMRRGVMTLIERSVLADAMKSPWRMGHGNPLPYELLTGAGSTELIELSLPVLERIVAHKKFIFVMSESSEEHIRLIGDALDPLEYAIVATAREYCDRVTRGHFTGDWNRVLVQKLRPFLNDVCDDILIGTYRATAFAPAQIFYAHKDHIHEAAHIAIADSVHLDHRGFPMLIETADNLCRGYFGAQTLERPAFVALEDAGAPFRHLGERITR